MKLTGAAPTFVKVTGIVSGPGPTVPVKAIADGVMVTPEVEDDFETVSVTESVFVAVPVAATLTVLV